MVTKCQVISSHYTNFFFSEYEKATKQHCNNVLWLLNILIKLFEKNVPLALGLYLKEPVTSPHVASSNYLMDYHAQILSSFPAEEQSWRLHVQVNVNLQKKALLRRESLQFVGAVVSSKRDKSVNCTLECKPHSRGGGTPLYGQYRHVWPQRV